MRNFEERKAEIFRRSELKMKQKRQRRNRFIACGVPVFICIVGLAVGSFVLKPTKMQNAEGEKGDGLPNMSETPISNSMTVSSNDYSIYLTGYEETQIKEVQGVLRDIIYSGEKENTALQNDNQAGQTDSNKGTTSEDVVSSYMIRIRRDDGVIENYLLNETSLVNLETKVEYSLSEEQTETIRQALEIEEK